MDEYDRGLVNYYLEHNGEFPKIFSLKGTATEIFEKLAEQLAEGKN